MSDNNIAVTNTVVEVVAVPISTFITQIIEVREPITTGSQGPQGIAGVTTLSTLTDVDASRLTLGSTLIYSPNVEKWIATTLLENQILEAGQF